MTRALRQQPRVWPNLVERIDMDEGIRCSRCGLTLPAEAFAPSHRRPGDWCRACRRSYNQSRYTPAPGKPPRAPQSTTPRVLLTHGAKPTGQRWRRLQEQVWATETHCGICGEYVDQTLPHNDSQARCLDHIVPLAAGGAMYERSNVRLAHRGCNSRNAYTERELFVRAALWFGSVF